MDYEKENKLWDMTNKNDTYKLKRGVLIMTKLNQIAMETRDFFLPILDFYDGEVLDFIPCFNSENTGMISIEVKFAHGIHFVLYQTFWRGYYYATRNGEQISHAYNMGKVGKDTHIYLQRFINDLHSGRFDKRKTTTEKHLKYIENNNLTSYMNKTRWGQVFDIIRQIEDQTGHDVLINYKLLAEDAEDCYWTMRGDEYLPGINSRYFQWLKIRPTHVTRVYRGRLLEDEYTSENHTDIFLEKISMTNIKYETLEDGTFIIYGYK